MRIGIVTLHNYNYGSVLQCFATQEYLRKEGCDCVVIDISGSVNPVIGKIRTLSGMVSLCMKYPKNVKEIFRLFMSQRGKGLSLSEESVLYLQRFNNTYLQRKVYTKSHLERIARTDRYNFFFSGSDQVWNGARVDEYYKYFLRFAPKVKRVAWATSFGGKEIASYNKKTYKKYIGEYNFISVREKSGVDIVQGITGRLADCLLDPVMLLNANEWRAKTALKYKGEKYILSFFIDKPSDKAVENVLRAERETGLSVITFGYRHAVFSDVVHKDGLPFSFLAAIDNAEYVFTDSFHAVAFATLFHKRFFVYERMYMHHQNQSARLTDFLNETGLSDRFNASFCAFDIVDFDLAESFFFRKREDAVRFLKQIIGNNMSTDKREMVQTEKCDCCGCGACADICAHKAIQMEADENGIIYPKINKDKCVECGLCTKVCSFGLVKKSDFKKDAFIAASKEEELIKYSASGGLFATIAKDVLDNQGKVYGASLWIDEGKIRCEHIGIENVEDLLKIQGSKYVQSKTEGVFPLIKNDLKSGRKVLFSGTSCQVTALKGFLRKDYDNLITIDLICHGVPGLKMLQDYIDSLSFKDHLIGISFRKRTKKGLPYALTLTLMDNNHHVYTKSISLRESAYYRLFMSNSGYRPSCYNCPYATVDKPADITLGDFYLNESKSDESIGRELKKAEMLSTLIIHSQKGMEMINTIRQRLVLRSVNVFDMQAQHGQLNNPSIPTRLGESLLALYGAEGFKGVQKAINRRNLFMFLPSLIKNVLNKIKT